MATSRKSSVSNPMKEDKHLKSFGARKRSTEDIRQVSDHMRRLSTSMKNNVADFFGVGKYNEKLKAEWYNRRLRYHNSIGKLKDDHLKASGEDQVDSSLYLQPSRFKIRDPLKPSAHHLSLSSDSTSITTDKKPHPLRKRKDSVISLTIKGMSSLTRSKASRQRQSITPNRSYAPASFPDETLQVPITETSIVDDVFFDEDVQESEKSHEQEPKKTHEQESEKPHEQESEKPHEQIPKDTVDEKPISPKVYSSEDAQPELPGGDTVDGFIGLSKIKDEVVAKVLDKPRKRHYGIGLLGSMLHQSIQSQSSIDVKRQIDELDDYRPYFTYWVTFVQIVVFLVSIAVYGAAPFGFTEHDYTEAILMPNLAIEFKEYRVVANMWFGPNQADLIHLGAKYSPCMRRDKNILNALKKDRALEAVSACCVRNDGSGCAQMTENRCSNTLSTFYDAKEMSINEKRKIQTVCGLDPKYCKKPASQAPFEWDKNILKWPVCEEVIKSNQSKASKFDRHMSCEIVARPCCHGIQGECFITTRQHCEFIRGYFHEEVFLCSQVDCLSQICGMIPFLYKDYPNQIYRLFTTLFLHAGLIHLILTVLYQMFLMRDIEKLAGSVRIALIYFGSGIAGNLASAIFLPYHVEAGPSGSQLGILACCLVEVLQSWKIQKFLWKSVVKFIVLLVFLFILGLLPWIDNWAHIFGFIVGMSLAFAFLPYVTFGTYDTRRKLILIFISLGLCILFFVILIILFYVSPIYQCDACQYFNCIPFANPTFCQNMQITIRRQSKYNDV